MKFIGQFPEKFDICLTCASGVESVLKKELLRLGYGDLPAENGRITLAGDKLALARLNVNLRTCDRVYVKVAEFNALSFDELFDGVKEIKWEDYLDFDNEIIVDGKCVKSQLFSISDCQKIIKKSIAERLSNIYSTNRLPETGNRIEVIFYLFKDKITLMLNSSGSGLHKRGYRDLVGIAPIKETLASALLLMSDFYYKRPFLDPFCGSGTLAIEGAKIALNIAPNKDRNFAFNYFKGFEEKYHKLAIEEATDKEQRGRGVEIFASDIDRKAIELSRHHALNAGLDGKIKFSVCDVAKLKLPTEYGTIVTNPPYGERVYDKREAELCYKNLGQALQKNVNWSTFVITENKMFERAFGKKADRKRKMYNSNKECDFYYYYGKKEIKND